MRDGGRSGCVPRDAVIYEPVYKAGRAEAFDAIKQMAETCRQCNDPTCVGRCPASVNIPKFVGEIAAGKFREAYETLREANILAAVCGFVCPAETLCEGGCINEHYTETVPIRHLQRWVSRKAVEEGWAAEARQPLKDGGGRVAVVGSGPAGVAAAVTLASLGHSVTLFERGTEAGGVAAATIPADRLPFNIVQKEAEDVLRSVGITDRRRLTINAMNPVDGILASGFDAVLIAAGLSKSAMLPGAARPVRGVRGALEFLACAKHGEQVGGSVLVLGGGNTAIDAAVSAKRAGATDVAIVYRRSFSEMPAWPEERDAAIKAGVNFLILTQPIAYEMDEHARLTGLRVARTRLAAPDADGRRMPVIIAGSEHVLPADLVIEAIGQQAGEELRQGLAGVEFTRAGLIAVHDGFATSRQGIFAAGDVVNGGATVVQAVAEGARAARQIDEFITKVRQPAEVCP
jgi:glutamate synthase (NADPH/NADH) small chain